MDSDESLFSGLMRAGQNIAMRDPLRISKNGHLGVGFLKFRVPLNHPCYVHRSFHFQPSNVVDHFG